MQLLIHPMKALAKGMAALIVCTASTWAAPPSMSIPSIATAVGTDSTPFGSPVAQKTRNTRKKKKSLSTVTSLVRDLRLSTYPEFTRVVFDLQREVTFTQSRLKKPDRVIIELQNARLSKTARRKANDNTLPIDITVAQSNPRSVTVSLNLDTIGDYRLLPLTDPDRLVVDVYNRTDQIPTRNPMGKSPSPKSPAISEAPRSGRPEIKTIVIDPGHGGKDPGAVGRSGTEEKAVTLQIGLKLRDLITQRLGRKAIMTRERDVFIELEDRAAFANSKNADLFISIHVNSHPQRSTKGLEVYHFGEASDRRALEVAARENGTPITETGVGWQYLVADLLATRKIQESLELAWSTKEAMVNRLDTHYDVVDHGVKTAPFYVLRFTSMPSILAEIAFISNPTEERLMQTDGYLTRMAESLFEGIKQYIYPVQTASN